MIEAHRLALFREVAHRGSFAQAAQALRLTPSAVSQQMAALERAARTRLFERSTRGVTLTVAGRALLRTADAVHGELHRAERALARLREEGPPSLTVATFSSAGAFLLAPALAALNQDLHVDTTVIESEPAQALAALMDGSADVALVYHFNSEQPPAGWDHVAGRCEYHPLLRDELRLVVPIGHALARRSTARLDAVADDPWIHGWDLPGNALDALASAQGLRPKVVCRSSDFRFMQALVAAGVGIAFIPALAVEEGEGTRALTVVPTAKRYIGAYTAPGTAANLATRALLTALKERTAVLRDR
ncbi:LysR family transcriptional regulator [Streptomyces sp. GESEQ-35]|uniref:LysR family transcriptional regulator n=1 Tax=Streptomyces sp. GESEQ-35 TaxID=2812657 RepID=UPI001B325F1C|nr:LysR family transcriptional regulator [Streptomyces sp. GESEQ-35]